MIINKQFVFILAAIILQRNVLYAQPMCTPIELQCEYLTHPLGIDMPDPRLSWRLNDARRGAAQTAYQIQVASDSTALANGEADLWDTGKVTSNQSNNIHYQGKPLTSRQQYFWRVTVWDKEGKPSDPSAIARWETGIFTLPEWEGDWISDGKALDFKPAPYFRKTLETQSKIKKARIYICGLGYFVLSMDGKKVGDHILDPAYSRYDKTAYYATYDVTKVLQDGNQHALGVVLGNGWYNEQSKAVWYFDQAPWRDRPKLLMNLYIEYENGKTDLIVSDTSWQVSHEGPVVFNNIYSGEYYDARKEMPGWDTYSCANVSF